MKFKAKLRKIGNSIGIYVPREAIGNYKIGDLVDFTTDVITEYTEKQQSVITKKFFNTEHCPKHTGSMKGTCGCK